MATVILLGTLDTKGGEYAYLRDRVTAAGCETVMINAGVLGDPQYPVEFSRHDVAAAAGADIDKLMAAGDRGSAVTTMAEGAAAVARRLYDAGRLDGIVGMGGSGGSSVISRAMRELPVGVPKLLLSTMASGDVSSFVGTSDIAMMYSVVDIAGINDLSARILGNAAAAVAGMAQSHETFVGAETTRPLVGVTMYGTTTPCIEHARPVLEAAGFELLVFHATGAGGRSMESLMQSGYITAVFDATTTELMDEVAGGTLTAGPDRLETAGSLGLPQVVSVGSYDQITFTPPDAVPVAYRTRTTYAHNPSITLVRSNPTEAAEFGRLLARKLNAARGPVTLFVPLKGASSYAVAGGVFYDPDADEALVSSLRTHVEPPVELVEVDTDINHPAFATAMARRLIEHYATWADNV